MVWWIENYGERRKGASKIVHLGFESIHDRIFESINIVYDCHNRFYDADDIHALANAGVNIINVDLTCKPEEYFKSVNEAVSISERMPEMYPRPYRPVGLSVVVSVNDEINIDKRIDIIILKDVTKAEQFHGFRRQNVKFTSIPILLWLSTFQIEDLNELIKISGGVVFYINSDAVVCYNTALKLCKQECKPIFFIQSTLISDYYEDTATDLQMLSIANKMVKDQVDGIVVLDQNISISSPIDAVRSFVKAVDIVACDVDKFKEYFAFSYHLPTPVIPPRAAAMSACLAALQCKARVILVLTTTGTSARLLASSSPPCLIVAITTRETTARSLHLNKKVLPLFYKSSTTVKWQEEVRHRIRFGTRAALQMGLCSAGAKLVVLMPSDDDVLYCNSFQIVQVPFRCEN